MPTKPITPIATPNAGANALRNQPSHSKTCSHQQTELDLSELAAQRAKRAEQRTQIARDLDPPCSEVFDLVVEASRKGEAYAELIGVTKSILSEMRKGERVVKLRDFLPAIAAPGAGLAMLGWLIERCPWVSDPKWALELMRPICARAGLVLPVPPAKVTREQVDPVVAAATRRLTDLWKLIRQNVAEELGTDEAEIERAYAPVAAASPKSG